GIGLTLSERFGREGMSVVLADIDEEQVANAQKKVKQTGAATLTVRTDVSKVQEVQALADATVAEFGAVHVLSNNAGVLPFLSPYHATDYTGYTIDAIIYISTADDPWWDTCAP
ncbi:MAG: SDR family oxidoreductase, partial [bacterium]|nr:SDR family oxidoreductase [bacterium]